MFAFGGDEEEDDILSAMAAAQYGEEDEPGQVHVSAAKQDTQNNMDEPKAEEGGIMKHYCGDNDIWNPRTRAPDIWFSNTWKEFSRSRENYGQTAPSSLASKKFCK